MGGAGGAEPGASHGIWVDPDHVVGIFSDLGMAPCCQLKMGHRSAERTAFL